MPDEAASGAPHADLSNFPAFSLVAAPLKKKTAIFALCDTDTVGRNSNWPQVNLAWVHGCRFVA